MIRALVAVTIVTSVSFVAACKKNVDPGAFDAGATTTAIANASAAANTDASVDPNAAVDAAVAPLASAAPVAHHPAAHGSARPSAGGPADHAVPPIDPPPCVNARIYCKNPNVGTDPKVKHFCESFSAECTAQGGHV